MNPFADLDRTPRQELGMYAVGLAGVILVANLADETARLPLFVLGVGALIGAWMLSRLRRNSPIGLRRAIPLATLAPPERAKQQPVALTRCEALIADGGHRDKAADLRLRPHLVELCRSGLAEVGVDLDHDRRGAADRLGPSVMATIEGHGVISTDELDELFTTLEGLQN